MADININNASLEKKTDFTNTSDRGYASKDGSTKDAYFLFTEMFTYLRSLFNNFIEVAVAQLDTDIAIKTGVADFPIKEDMAFDSAFINVGIAPVGADAIYDINIDGATALSTKITIEAGETSSLTAANQPVFSTLTATKGQQATIDCDQPGASTAGQNPVLVIIYKKN